MHDNFTNNLENLVEPVHTDRPTTEIVPAKNHIFSIFGEPKRTLCQKLSFIVPGWMELFILVLTFTLIIGLDSRKQI